MWIEISDEILLEFISELFSKFVVTHFYIYVRDKATEQWRGKMKIARRYNATCKRKKKIETGNLLLEEENPIKPLILVILVSETSSRGLSSSSPFVWMEDKKLWQEKTKKSKSIVEKENIKIGQI